MTRPWLAPLTPLYAAATAARNFAFERGILRPRRLPRPVVSVGAITAGGAGKTPLVIALCDILRDSGHVPVVLSRGYGRKSSGIVRVRSHTASAESGDEPLLIRRTTGEEVWVNADRYTAGMAALHALSDNPHIVFLLDDGFQHRQLHRDLNIVLVSRADLADSLLPAGNLREPLRSLSRADILALNEDDADAFPQFRERFEGASCTRPAAWVYTSATDTAEIAGRRIYAFCGIARPQRFFSALGNAHLTGSRVFADHHHYSDNDLHVLAGEAQRLGAQAIVTTEKDLVRISDEQQNRLSAAVHLYGLPLRLALAEPRLYAQQVSEIVKAGASN